MLQILNKDFISDTKNLYQCCIEVMTCFNMLAVMTPRYTSQEEWKGIREHFYYSNGHQDVNDIYSSCENFVKSFGIKPRPDPSVIFILLS